MTFSDMEARHVVVSEPVMRDLRRLAIEGFVALPRRGLEVGGLLLGQPDAGEIRIAGFEEAPCEHRYGPSYALSESDRVQLAELLAKRRGGKLPVTGFFRSFTSRDPVIEEADEAFVREHFRAGDFVFLALQPLSAENCIASLRLFRDGQLLPETEDPPANFDAPQVAVAEPVTKRKAEAPLLPPSYRAQEKEPDPERVEAPPAMREQAPAWAAQHAPRRAHWWIPAVIFLSLIAGGAVGYRLWTLAQEPRWTELYLNARPVNGRLDVSWNGSSQAALHATRGLLAVTDADTHRDIELGQGEIRTGKYTLPASHGDVELRLILYAKGLGIAGDSLRLATIANPVVTPQTSVSDRTDRPVPTQAPAEVEPDLRVAVPPLVVRELQPGIPEGIRSRISGRVVIPVEVEVSAYGRVVRAVAEAQTADGVHRYLAEQAVKAAREWRFAPARTKSGAPVAASKTIDFVFTP
jgi:hypothetical protein